MYANDAEEILDVLREQPDDETLLLVGHNPSVHQLVLDLTGASEDQGYPDLGDGRRRVRG